MNAVLLIVQFGLVIICAVSGVAGVVLLIIDHVKPKHKTTKCRDCFYYWPISPDYGNCIRTDRKCRPGQRACHYQKRGL